MIAMIFRNSNHLRFHVWFRSLLILTPSIAPNDIFFVFFTILSCNSVQLPSDPNGSLYGVHHSSDRLSRPFPAAEADHARHGVTGACGALQENEQKQIGAARAAGGRGLHGWRRLSYGCKIQHGCVPRAGGTQESRGSTSRPSDKPCQSRA